MEYNYSKLNGKIREVYKTQKAFAEAMTMAESTLNFKLNNKSQWSQGEMLLAMKLLKEPSDKINEYFFAH